MHVGAGGGESFGEHGGQVDFVGSGYRVCSFLASVTMDDLSKNHARPSIARPRHAGTADPVWLVRQFCWTQPFIDLINDGVSYHKSFNW
jgi:hypothetical protein